LSGSLSWQTIHLRTKFSLSLLSTAISSWFHIATDREPEPPLRLKRWLADPLRLNGMSFACASNWLEDSFFFVEPNTQNENGDKSHWHN
jgi:hypothetical protein